MQENNGIRMALSPVQLAAVLADKSVSEGETLSNRLWGGLGLANGLVEMFGAGVMCIAPNQQCSLKSGVSSWEPTAWIRYRLPFVRYGPVGRSVPIHTIL